MGIVAQTAGPAAAAGMAVYLGNVAGARMKAVFPSVCSRRQV
jgi:hypothetical protein